jgi:hypothetical protein
METEHQLALGKDHMTSCLEAALRRSTSTPLRASANVAAAQAAPSSLDLQDIYTTFELGTCKDMFDLGDLDKTLHSTILNHAVLSIHLGRRPLAFPSRFLPSSFRAHPLPRELLLELLTDSYLVCH